MLPCGEKVIRAWVLSIMSINAFSGLSSFSARRSRSICDTLVLPMGLGLAANREQQLKLKVWE
jgi:hypothetical protein